MSLKVRGHFLLVKPDPPKESFQIPEALKATGFEIGMTPEQEKRELAGSQIGTLVGIGNTAWRAYDGDDPMWEPWGKVGDRIIFARYGGKIVQDPETLEKFMIINDSDMQALVEGEATPFED